MAYRWMATCGNADVLISRFCAASALRPALTPTTPRIDRLTLNDALAFQAVKLATSSEPARWALVVLQTLNGSGPVDTIVAIRHSRATYTAVRSPPSLGIPLPSPRGSWEVYLPAATLPTNHKLYNLARHAVSSLQHPPRSSQPVLCRLRRSRSTRSDRSLCAQHRRHFLARSGGGRVVQIHRTVCAGGAMGHVDADQ